MICVFAGAQRPHFLVAYQSTNLSICQSFNLCCLQPQIVCCPKLQNIFNLRALLTVLYLNFEMSKLPATTECPCLPLPLLLLLPPPAPSPDTANGWQIFPHIFGCMHFWPQANGLLQLSFSCCCSFFCCCCCYCCCFSFCCLSCFSN